MWNQGPLVGPATRAIISACWLGYPYISFCLFAFFFFFFSSYGLAASLPTEVSSSKRCSRAFSENQFGFFFCSWWDFFLFLFFGVCFRFCLDAPWYLLSIEFCFDVLSSLFFGCATERTYMHCIRASCVRRRCLNVLILLSFFGFCVRHN